MNTAAALAIRSFWKPKPMLKKCGLGLVVHYYRFGLTWASMTGLEWYRLDMRLSGAHPPRMLENYLWN